MSDDMPERIWLCEYHFGYRVHDPKGPGDTEYVRTDTVADRIRDAENKAAMKTVLKHMGAIESAALRGIEQWNESRDDALGPLLNHDAVMGLFEHVSDSIAKTWDVRDTDDGA